MHSPVETIKERLSIVDVVSSYLTVIKAGKNYKAKCPFHNEKTPSFFISPERGSYYCFGCSAKGDIFSFVQHFEGIDFLGSLKILAERAGVPLTSYRDKANDKTEIFYKIMEEVTLFFENNFAVNKEARSYLLSRGLTDESIKLFRIGYAKESWTSAFEYLSSKGFRKEDIEIVGLVKKKDSRYYDRFRGRIMFPISDSSGRIIAFSGRIFSTESHKTEVGLPNIEQAKYLNSPDTPLFNKSNILFGLDKAKSSIRSRDYSIVVEGQMDLILSHQAGLTNTVAVSGTAFTDKTIDNPLRQSSSEASESKINNLGLVRRLSSNIIFAYDGDDAGIRAASRSAMIALSLDMQVKVAILPKGKDPADIIFDNQNKWKDIIKNSVNIVSFHLDRICRNSSDTRERGKKVREIIFPFLLMISSSIEKSAYIKEIHSKTGISEDAIIDDFKKYEKNASPTINKDGGIKDLPGMSAYARQSGNNGNNSRRDSLEKRLFGIFFWKGGNDDQKKFINDERNSFENDIGGDEFQKILILYEPFSDNLAFAAETLYSEHSFQLEKDMKEIILNLKEELLKEQAKVLFMKINEKEKSPGKENINDDIIEYQKIVEKIEEIKNCRLK